jgi:putative mobilizable transposon, tnpC protein
MILEKIREKSYYIPFIMIIVLIVMSTLYLNAILTNRLQNTIYIDIMSLLGGVLFLCIFAIIIILPVEILLTFQIIINFYKKNMIQLKAKANKKLHKNDKQELIKLSSHQKNISIYKKSIENTVFTNNILHDSFPTNTTSNDSFPINTATNNTNDYNTVSPDSIPINTASSDIINDNINNTCINSKNKEKNKFDIVEKYIIEIFSEYCSEEDVKNIYAAIKAYSNGVTDFSNYPSVSILESKYKNSEYKILKPLDLYHFGWNIWNHFKDKDRRKQVVIANLLKTIFAENFPETSIKTIKSHLKDDEEKGKIIIKEDLSKLNE